MMHSIVRLALTICFALTGPASADTPRDRLQALLDSFQSEYGFPGATASVAMPDGRVISVASGLADQESGALMTPETRMLAASIGKTFVAMTALSLEDEGALSRAGLVSDYLADRDWFARLPNSDTMTFGDLLRHGAGLPDHVHLETFQAEMATRMSSGTAALTPEEAIAFVLSAETLFDAGSGWAYTDTGYLLLGLVIEEASGRPYYDLVSDRFLAPLSLTATAPSNTPSIPGLAVGYVAEDNPFGLPARTMDDAGNLV